MYPPDNPLPSGPGFEESAESKEQSLARGTLWEANLKLADAMKNKDCAGLFDPKQMNGVTPNQIFMAMISRTSIGGMKLELDFDRSANNTAGPAQVTRTSSSIKLSLKAGYWNSNANNGDWNENIGMMIHEIGHVAVLLFGQGASQMTTPDVLGTDDRASLANDALVKKKCFP